MGDTPVQGPSGGLSGAGYLHEVIPARQTPPVRSQSARALVAGDADGLLPADSLLPADEHPLAARAPNATIEMSQCFIFVCHLSSRFQDDSRVRVQVPCRRHWAWWGLATASHVGRPGLDHETSCPRLRIAALVSVTRPC